MKTTRFLIFTLLALLSRSMFAAAACPQTWSGNVWQTFEAESGTASGAYVIGATGGQTYWSTASDNNNGNGNVPDCASAGCVDFSFTIAAADVGYYKFQANIIDVNKGDSSVFGGIVGVNDTCQDGSGNGSSGSDLRVWRTPLHSSWQWEYLTDRKAVGRSGAAADARVWYLNAGTYTFRFVGRENNFLIDKMRILRNIVSTPTPTPSFSKTPTPAGTFTKTPTYTNTPFGTPTFTASPTRTPTPLPPVWGGLPSDMRPYGLEYIPFPVESAASLGANTFYPLEITFSSLANNHAPRNTARWRIVLADLSDTVGSQIAIETRIGPYGVSCSSGVFDAFAYASATTLTLPSRPQNASVTYLWLDGQPPETERFDAVGDPRFMPYKDCLGLPSTETYANGYNWFFRDFTDSSYNDVTQTPRYLPFIPQAKYDTYCSPSSVWPGPPGANFDVPKLYGLIREGIISSASVYNSITGYSAYYAGLGGEMGGDSSNKLSNGIPAYGGPWNAGATANVDEIIGADGRSGVVDAVETVKTSSWISKPFIGELWPDTSYVADWSGHAGFSVWGNLTNIGQGGSAYRDELQNQSVAGVLNYHQSKKRVGPVGCATFFNGNGGSNTFNHDGGTTFNAALIYDGTIMANDYNFSMPTVFNVNRQWGINMGGNQPQEWNTLPYNGRRPSLAIYSGAPTATAAQNTWGFYQASAAGTTTNRASAAVRGSDSTGVISPQGVPAAGWFVINGLAPSTDSGINFVARFSILSCLRTFADAGAPTQFAAWTNLNNKVGINTYRIPPIPLITVSEPAVGQQTKGLNTILIKWNERYARWDGKGYTENYPCLDATYGPCTSNNSAPNPALEWHDTAQIAFNIKWTADGSHWYSALTGTQGQLGVYMDQSDSIAGNSTHLYVYPWTITTVSPNGPKTVRVECYRPKIGNHYSYHEISFVTGP